MIKLRIMTTVAAILFGQCVVADEILSCGFSGKIYNLDDATTHFSSGYQRKMSVTVSQVFGIPDYNDVDPACREFHGKDLDIELKSNAPIVLARLAALEDISFSYVIGRNERANTGTARLLDFHQVAYEAALQDKKIQALVEKYKNDLEEGIPPRPGKIIQGSVTRLGYRGRLSPPGYDQIFLVSITITPRGRRGLTYSKNIIARVLYDLNRGSVRSVRLIEGDVK